MRSLPLSIFRAPLLAMALLFAGGAQIAAAYPAAPASWTWKFYEDARFYPAQISTCTDPDGRLRTLFVDTQGFRYYNDSSGAHRVCKAIMGSFRPFTDNTVIEEFEEANLGSFTTTTGTDKDVSYDAALTPRRTSVYGVTSIENKIRYGGGLTRLLSSETFGDYTRGRTYHGYSRDLAYRPVLGSSNTSFNFGFTGDTPEILSATSIAGPIDNRVFLEWLPSYSAVRLIYYQDETTPRQKFSYDLSDLMLAGWGTGRIITGAHLAATLDRRDFYAFITSYKIQPDNTFLTEARLFRLRTTGTYTANPNESSYSEIGIASTSSTVLDIQSLPAGTNPTASFAYPNILLAASGEPRWAVWSGGSTGRVKLAKRLTPASGNIDELRQSITTGYLVNTSGNPGDRGAGSGASAALDRLDRVQLAYRRTSDGHLIYELQGATEDMTTIPFNGNCTGAPSLSVGPGSYPYIVYRGNTPTGGSGDDKLIFAYTTQLATAYAGDFEDRDKDGRIGLVETTAGSSDTVTNPPYQVTPQITTYANTTKHFRLIYQLAPAATRVGTTTEHQLLDRGDTISIQPNYSLTLEPNSFLSSGFVQSPGYSPVNLPNQPQSVGADDTAAITSYLKQFYRLNIKRNIGPP